MPKFRVEDTMVTVELEPAVIDFVDILEACEVVDDEWSSAPPWKEHDGYDHETERAGRGDEDRRGYATPERSANVVVILSDKIGDDDYRWARDHGQSKQVAAELRARCRQHTLDQLVKWYSDGWNWYTVRCEFRGVFDSLSGIDSYEYADGDCRLQVAGEVAYQLEQQGYTVENKPEPEKRTRHSQLNSFNWS